MPCTALVCRPQIIALLDLVNKPLEVEDDEEAGATEVLVFCFFASEELALTKHSSVSS